MRATVIIGSLIAFLIIQSPAHAHGHVTEDAIAQIQSDGYTIARVKRSWLGRIVITAIKDDELREVVLNRTSGAVLRDQKFPNEGLKSRANGPQKAHQPGDHSQGDGQGKPNDNGGSGDRGDNGGSGDRGDNGGSQRRGGSD